MGLVLNSMRETSRLRERTKSAIIELADLIDQRDSYTFGHSQRVSAYAERLAKRMRLSAPQVDPLPAGARLPHIGKIPLPRPRPARPARPRSSALKALA